MFSHRNTFKFHKTLLRLGVWYLLHLHIALQKMRCKQHWFYFPIYFYCMLLLLLLLEKAASNRRWHLLKKNKIQQWLDEHWAKGLHLLGAKEKWSSWQSAILMELIAVPNSIKTCPADKWEQLYKIQDLLHVKRPPDTLWEKMSKGNNLWSNQSHLTDINIY